MGYSWNWDVLLQQSATGDGTYLGWMFYGFKMTIGLSLSAWLLALILGSLIGVLRSVPNKILSGLATAYVELFRNIPLLVQLFIWYFVLPELLPAALGMKNGDVKIIKNAGGVISHPYGSVIRSLLVCIYELGIEEIMVIGHYDCGMQNLQSEKITEKMLCAGISAEAIEKVKSEIDYDKWLKGFDCVEKSVADTVKLIKIHPLIPKNIHIHGLLMDPDTGRLDIVNT